MVSAMSGGAFEVRRFDRIDSTNRYLAEEARQGAPEGVVAVAAFQTAGQGRLGRRWEAPPGVCLLASVLLRPDVEPSALHLCTVLLALCGVAAAHDAAGVSPGVKWPNDLVGPDGKVGGVLAEVVTAPDGGRSVVVGIGVNVSWPGPPGAGGTSLELMAGRPVDLDSVLDSLLRALRAKRPQLDSAAGRTSLVAELRERCVTLGQDVRVELPTGHLTGRAVDVDDEGRLVLDVDDGTRRVVAAGDVVHLRRG
jgi:BirA family biotin operon repressor/biotin-[acetyl-CoA-carboxylase] ligase